jgi:enoyl-CoA hydratase
MADEPSDDWVRIERKGAVGIVWLDHPPLNILSAPVLTRLTQRLDELESDTGIRAVVLASAMERAFAAGADLKQMALMGAREAHRYGGQGQSVTRRIERLPLPVVAAVHGACLGGGCEIAQACDFILASDDARFGQPEVNLGISPGWGGTQRLPVWIGPQAAREWVYSGRTVSAEEARQAGLVYAVVERALLLDRAVSMAQEFARKSPLALAAAKYAMQRASDPALDSRLSFELALWERLFGTQDQRRGMASFIEKTPFVPGGREHWVEESRGFPWSTRLRRRPTRVHRPPPGRGKSKN